LLESEVDAIVNANPDADFENMYYWLKGKKGKELDAKMAKNVEKRTIANLHDRSRRKSIRRSDGGSSDNLTPSSVLDRDSIDMAIAFGNDPREIAKYVRKNNKKRS